MRRVRLNEEGGREAVTFFSSGCAILDSVLGGGYAERRVINVVGDRSTGKTLLAEEAAINFLRKHPQGIVRYIEGEAALDQDYARNIGMDWERTELIEDFESVEDVFEDLTELTQKKKTPPTLYIVDSLDSLSDRAEMGRAIDEASYGMTKARQMSQGFRRLTRKLRDTNITVLIISQVRSRIVSFGRNKSRSGGEALSFYASQILWLSELSKIQKTRHGVKRTVGVEILAYCDKNKVGLPFRDCRLPIFFYYGIDDVRANLEWLKRSKRLSDVGLTNKSQLGTVAAKIGKLGRSERNTERDRIAKATMKAYSKIETSFLPESSKYG